MSISTLIFLERSWCCRKPQNNDGRKMLQNCQVCVRICKKAWSKESHCYPQSQHNVSVLFFLSNFANSCSLSVVVFRLTIVTFHFHHYHNYSHYYTFKLHSCFLLVDIHQLILNIRKPWHHFHRISWIIRRSCQKKIIGRWWHNNLATKITKQQKWPAAVWKVKRMSLFTANLFLHRCFERVIKLLLNSAYA